MFNFKSNSDSSGSDTQKYILYIGGGLFAVLNIWLSLKGPSTSAPTRSAPVVLQPGQTIWHNPDVSWHEKHFCRGYEHSEACSFQARHPDAALTNFGSKSRRKKRVIAETLHTSKSKLSTGKITLE